MSALPYALHPGKQYFLARQALFPRVWVSSRILYTTYWYCIFLTIQSLISPCWQRSRGQIARGSFLHATHLIATLILKWNLSIFQIHPEDNQNISSLKTNITIVSTKFTFVSVKKVLAPLAILGPWNFPIVPEFASLKKYMLTIFIDLNNQFK